MTTTIHRLSDTGEVGPALHPVGTLPGMQVLRREHMYEDGTAEHVAIGENDDLYLLITRP